VAEQKVAIVTAASRGMGAACARELGTRGFALALMARSADVLTLAEQLGALGLQGSVTVEADLRRLVDATLERHGRVDVVVSNTGHPAKGELLELADEEWHAGLDLLLLNVVRMARLLTPTMLAQGSGVFVNISSFAAVEPGLRFPVSATLRAALGNFAKLYSRRYAADGLRMNNVLPGWIDTYPVDAESVRAIPQGRAGSAEEVAKVVAFLASEAASYITGASLLVDGGLVRAV
jgi:NAD(P)-dependent dehydrogenase (short-subunit alcohol dehydrogenase family)